MKNKSVAYFYAHVGPYWLAVVSLHHPQFYLRFPYTRFPYLKCLHALSITRRFHAWSFTRCFHYTRIPYPLKRLYRPFPYMRIQSAPIDGLLEGMLAVHSHGVSSNVRG